MRADRLVQMMILLQNRGKMTTQQLAEELEVSKRTILRDMEALSVSGIPIVADRGKAGGWRLMDQFRSQLSGMKLENLKSLFILPSEHMLQQLGIVKDGMDIRDKLLASLPDSTKTEARNYLEKVYVDSSTWKPSVQKQDIFQIMMQALWEDKKLTIQYVKANGECTERCISPLGIIAKGSVWYLAALTEGGDYRSFRVTRVHDARMELENFTRPSDFSLSAYWNESKKQFVEQLPRYEVQVLAHHSIVRRLTFTGKFVHKVWEDEREDHHWLPVTLRFNDEQEACEFVLGFGPQIRLLEPEHLIERIVEQAAAVVKLYSID
ncbi:helix-turn-helix transcriptional regulator [Marinicrinis lubricantis]|uniref:Helix-turn-helix transcriptional regulator n=1 Tax=Marinicrinis lubricantis TaxID=2086470 RepID=A0ABW1IK51_9BACL